jgi:hypothetical protein
MPIDWKKLDETSSVSVPARPATGLWTVVRSYVSTGQIIHIEARGTWRPVAEFDSCGGDGMRHWAFAGDRLLCKKAPLGALIGKIGGSGASSDDSEIFLVGSVAVITIDKTQGPLYLTINDAPEFFGDNDGSLEVTIG